MTQESEAMELIVSHGRAVRDVVLVRGRGIAAGKRLDKVEAKLLAALLGRKPTTQELDELRRLS
jgi:hypothetical protein